MLKQNPFTASILRNWHVHAGVFIALPLIVVGLTAALLIHSGPLSLSNVQVNVSALPGYQDAHLSIVRSALTTKDGREFIGTRDGVFEITPSGNLKHVESITENDIRVLRETPVGILAGGKKGLWLNQGQTWQKLYKGDVWDANTLPDNTIRIADRGKGILESADLGKHWLPNEKMNNALKGISGKANLTELVLNLHTGFALFKDWRWIWVDIAGLGLVFLTISGLTLWFRSKKKKRFKANSIPANLSAKTQKLAHHG